MKNEWTSFRITVILYIMVALLPFSFYFVYRAFHDIKADTAVVRSSSWNAGAVLHMTLTSSVPERQHVSDEIDMRIHEIALWVEENRNSTYYVGATSLSDDFQKTEAVWKEYKEKISAAKTERLHTEGLYTYNIFENLALVIEKMVYFKQNHLINMFYLSLTAAMILLLLVIYFIREYIRQQIKKNAIYDTETKLYNKNYMLAELKSTCARAKRYNYPLSLLSIAINGCDGSKYDEKTRAHIFEMIGGVLISMTRTSDVACRYNENHLAVILPFTEKENAEILKKRIQKRLEETDFFMAETQPEFILTVIEYNCDDSVDLFIDKASETLEA